jgi:D-serine deaminase-like pyridoxal phosphate-dependent protein
MKDAEPIHWFLVNNVEEIPSPALLVYRERVESNLRRMVAIAGRKEHLRPHIKTCKMREVVELMLGLGITRFKCATIAEAEMAASAGAPDVLLAYQPVGPGARRLAELVKHFPGTEFSVSCDDEEAIRGLSAALSAQRSKRVRRLEVLLDIDVGQHRTGVAAGPRAVEIYQLIDSLPGLKVGGLHAYDGHVSDSDPAVRAANCEVAFASVKALRTQLETGGRLPRVVAGGSPTFPIHARRGDVECSPGTCVLWDAGYARKLADLPFQNAAVVLTRVISKPCPTRLCLDLGHKALGSEMPHPRAEFPQVPDAKAVLHSEEHLVIETVEAAKFTIGDCLYAVPWHICPTVALYSSAAVVENGGVRGTWKVAARDRCLTI